MQVQKQPYLPLRGRYYHAAMDINQLHAGADYTELRPSFIIFICTFDYYEMEEPIYFFENMMSKNPCHTGTERLQLS